MEKKTYDEQLVLAETAINDKFLKADWEYAKLLEDITISSLIEKIANKAVHPRMRLAAIGKMYPDIHMRAAYNNLAGDYTVKCNNPPYWSDVCLLRTIIPEITNQQLLAKIANDAGIDRYAREKAVKSLKDADELIKIINGGDDNDYILEEYITEDEVDDYGLVASGKFLTAMNLRETARERLNELDNIKNTETVINGGSFSEKFEAFAKISDQEKLAYVGAKANHPAIRFLSAEKLADRDKAQEIYLQIATAYSGMANVEWVRRSIFRIETQETLYNIAINKRCGRVARETAINRLISEEYLLKIIDGTKFEFCLEEQIIKETSDEYGAFSAGAYFPAFDLRDTARLRLKRTKEMTQRYFNDGDAKKFVEKYYFDKANEKIECLSAYYIDTVRGEPETCGGCTLGDGRDCSTPSHYIDRFRVVCSFPQNRINRLYLLMGWSSGGEDCSNAFQDYQTVAAALTY